MAVSGMRDSESGSTTIKILVAVGLFVGYMVYTDTYNPIVAAQNLFDTILGLLPPDAANTLRRLPEIAVDLFYQFVQELRRLLN